jgi:hypothetical protein
MVSYLATATLAIGVLASAPQPIEWQADYGAALAATRAGEQPLLVVLDKPNSAEARIEPALLREGAAEGPEADLLDDYNLCHVDVTTDYGKKVAKAFKVKRFPHLAIIDRTGSVIIFAKSGKIDGPEFDTVLTKHRDGIRPAVRRVSYKLSDGTTSSTEEAKPVYRNPGYCPSCQRRSM